MSDTKQDENQNDGCENNMETCYDIDVTSEENKQLIQYFKNYVVGNNRDEFNRKLSESVEFRRNLLISPPEPIHKMFGFYFADPSIVNILYCIANHL